jgi:hypothetical protein
MENCCCLLHECLSNFDLICLVPIFGGFFVHEFSAFSAKKSQLIYLVYELFCTVPKLKLMPCVVNPLFISWCQIYVVTFLKVCSQLSAHAHRSSNTHNNALFILMFVDCTESPIILFIVCMEPDHLSYLP